MIDSRYYNKLVGFLVVLAVVFSVLLRYFPDRISITERELPLPYETKLFDKKKVMSVDLAVNKQEWEDLLKNAIQKEYISCDVLINGEKFSNVGIRAKGNTSLSTVASDDTTDRYSFKLEFDHYLKNQTCYGLDKLALNNIIQDNSYMKEYMAYDLIDFMGVPSSLFSFAEVSVNGEPWGLYLAVEVPEESYAERNFGSSYGNLYKPESMNFGQGNRSEAEKPKFEYVDGQKQDSKQSMGPPSFLFGNQPGENDGPPNNMFPGGFGSMNGCDLAYNGDDLENYSAIWEGSVFDTKEKDHKRVVKALKNISEGNLEESLDVDGMLRYIAVNSMIVNYDSYFGSLSHNYYLYEKDGRLSMLPWDYNLAFAGFQINDAESAVNDPIDEPVSGTTLTSRPLAGQVLAVREYMEQYHSYLKQMVEEYFDSGRWEQTIQEVDELIRGYVKNDPSAFCTYDEYEKAVETLKQFGLLRAESVRGQLDGTIGSTAEQQKKDTFALVNADGIQLSDMGTQGGGGLQKGMTPPGQNDGFPEQGMVPPNQSGGFQGQGMAPPDQSSGGFPGQGMAPPGRENGTWPDGNDRPDRSQYPWMTQEKVDWQAVGVNLCCVIAECIALICVKRYSRRKYKNRS